MLVYYENSFYIWKITILYPMEAPKNRHGHVDSRWAQGATLDFTVSDLTLVDLDLDQGGTSYGGF